MSQWVVYILRCRTGHLYTGITNDIQRRLKEHANGVGSKFTRSRRPVVLVHKEPAASRSEALRRERAIKRMSRAQKDSIVSESARVSPPPIQ